MRKFTVKTTTIRNSTVHRISRPSKDIQLGDLIEFKFSTDTVKAVVRPWTRQKECAECALFRKDNKPPRCVRYADRDGHYSLLCDSHKGFPFEFVSIDDLMEEI